jgi:hypothetical protein
VQLEEIATGHRSMLSAPDALAKVLQRTAAASAIDQSAQKH